LKWFETDGLKEANFCKLHILVNHSAHFSSKWSMYSAALQSKVVFQKLARDINGIPIHMAIPHLVGPFATLVHIYLGTIYKIAIELM